MMTGTARWTSRGSWRSCRQGLTLVHYSAQRTRFLKDKGCILGLFRGCRGGVWVCQQAIRVYVVSEAAQFEVRSGRV